MLRFAQERANQVWYVSKPQFERFRDLSSAHNHAFLGNPVDTEYYVPRVPNAREKSPIAILFIGSPAERKGLDILYQAVTTVHDSLAAQLRVICVVKNLEEDWVKMIKESPHSSIFKFLTYQDKERLRELFYACDFVAAPSREESFSYAVAEGLSCGKPVIVSACGGPEWYVTKEMGILCRPNHSESFFEAVMTMLNEYQTYDPEKLH
ncbi:glycosyltransferase, partial [bacterium]|nr:glycosyltransferase [bacterium]